MQRVARLARALDCELIPLVDVLRATRAMRAVAARVAAQDAALTAAADEITRLRAGIVDLRLTAARTVIVFPPAQAVVLAADRLLADPLVTIEPGPAA